MNDKTETRPHIGQAEMLPADELTADELVDYPEGSIGEAAVQAGRNLQKADNHGAIASNLAGAMRAVEPHPLTMLQTALEAGHDVEKLGRLMDLADRYEANQARKSFAVALSKFQGTVPDIVESKMATVTMQSGGSYTYNYADLDTIMRAIRPTLKKCGLSVRYDAEISDDGKRIRSTCYVMHRDGHTETTAFVVPVDEAMKVNDSQKMGSANSYACRYNLCNALALTTGEDDDGGSLHGDKREEGENKRSSAAPAPAKATDLDQFCPIGKHKGCRWEQVPPDYLEWMIANLDDKPDIVAKAKHVLESRFTDDTNPDDVVDEGELTMAECARAITNATHVDKLDELWKTVPDKHREGLEAFYKTRRDELMGNDKRGPDPKGGDTPF